MLRGCRMSYPLVINKTYRVTDIDGNKKKLTYSGEDSLPGMKGNVHVFADFNSLYIYSIKTIKKVESFDEISVQSQAKSISEEVLQDYLKYGYAVVNGKKLRKKFIYKPLCKGGN